MTGTVAVWLMGAAAAGGVRSAVNPCPPDLHVQYEWRAGPLPPPYHYEVTIEIRGSGEGVIVMIPDYPTDQAPVWTETFSIAREALDQFCAKLAAEGLWTEPWRSLDEPLLGGSSESLTVTGHSRTVSVPPFPAHDQKARAAAIVGAVKGLVPKSLWEKLDGQRQQYQRGPSAQS